VQAETVRGAVVREVRRAAKGEAARSAGDLQRELESLKRDYITVYADQHKRHTLGAEADDRRARLIDSERLKTLRTLAQVEIFGMKKVTDIQNVLVALPTCREFHEGIIKDAPTCPNCRLKPSQYTNAAPAEERLKAVERGMDTLLQDWRRTLKEELEAESVRRSVAAMEPAERSPIEAFLAQADDAVTVPESLIKAVNDALHGIETIALGDDDLIEALQRGGMPTTRHQIEQRFRAFLDSQMHGKDVRATRLVLAGRQDDDA
jgi:hypothetical protein